MSNLTPEDQEEAKRAAALSAAHKIDWKLMNAYYAHQAKALKGKYDALRAEGFDPAQAMYLCTQEWK